MSSSGDVSSVYAYDEGFDYRIRIDLPREVNAGDCVSFSVQVHQYGLARVDEASGQIGFHFTPGWFDEVPVDHLIVTWLLPADPALIVSMTPDPVRQEYGQAIWETALQPGEKYPLSVVYDGAAFPDFNPDASRLSGAHPGEFIRIEPAHRGFQPAGDRVRRITACPAWPHRYR